MSPEQWDIKPLLRYAAFWVLSVDMEHNLTDSEKLLDLFVGFSSVQFGDLRADPHPDVIQTDTSKL